MSNKKYTSIRFLKKNMATESQQQQQPRMLHFLVSTNKTEFPYQVRYPASMAFVEFKIKLELVVGIYAQDMRLELHSPEGKFMAELFGDDKTLEELGIADNSLVHVHDVTGNSPAIGQLPSESSTAADDQHYVMPDEKYDSRKESVRKWKQELLASQKTLPPAGDQKAMPDSLQVGKSCVVHVSGQPRRFAQIAYVGPTQFGARPGQDCWVGVVYEEAVGKNDGSLEGKRYFTCEPRHGGFVRPSTVEVIEEDGHLPAQLEQAKAAPMEEI